MNEETRNEIEKLSIRIKALEREVKFNYWWLAMMICIMGSLLEWVKTWFK